MQKSKTFYVYFTILVNELTVIIKLLRTVVLTALMKIHKEIMLSIRETKRSTARETFNVYMNLFFVIYYLQYI